MASASITNLVVGIMHSASKKDSVNLKLTNDSNSISIIESNNLVKSISRNNFGIAKPDFDRLAVNAQSVLPFRVRFYNVGIIGYNANNPPPVGVAVIGLNNYIL